MDYTKLSEELALDVCISLWLWLAEDGDRRKDDWPGWEIFKKMSADCPLCEFSKRKEESGEQRNLYGYGFYGYGFYGLTRCEHCPFYKKFGSCCRSDSFFIVWRRATDADQRKDAAEKFLKQLYQLKEERQAEEITGLVVERIEKLEEEVAALRHEAVLYLINSRFAQPRFGLEVG